MGAEEWIGLAFFALVAAAVVASGVTDSAWLRRTAWLGVGIIGLPAAVIASLYFVGVPIVLLTIGSGYVFRRWGWWPYFVAGSVGLVCVALIAWELTFRQFGADPLPDEFAAEVVIGVSITAALASSAKLGEMWAKRGAARNDEAAMLS